MNQIFIFLAAITIFSCGKDDKDLLNPVEPKYDLTKVIADPDVAYGSASSNIMDVYLPANRSTTRTKVIVLIHGGAWADAEKYGQRKGDKSDFAAVIDSLRRRMPDWAIFNLNYTLATITGILPPKGNNVFPVQEKDVKKAVQYIYDNRQAFSISDQWVLAGASAGAHLAMLQAYKNYSTIRPKAVVNLFGPVDMTALYNQSDSFTKIGLEILLSGNPSANPAMYFESSPINFVNTQSPPTIILHGGNDDVVPVEQSIQLKEKLIAAGVKYEYADYLREQTHGWSDPSIWTKSLNSIQNFLTVNVP